MTPLEELEAIIADRKNGDAAKSWTAQLLQAGRMACAKKMGEEAVEAALAGACGSRKAVIAESADLLYHLLVMLSANDVQLKDVCAELERRRSMSGLQEKSSRQQPPGGTGDRNPSRT